MAAPSSPRPPRSAARRSSRSRVRHFAQGGYHGTSTEAIAREAGISQPYLFRLFRTKRELFLACDGRHARPRSSAAFAAAAAAARRRSAWTRWATRTSSELLPDRHALLFQMQSYAACADPDIRAHVRERFGELVRQVAEAGRRHARARLWTSSRTACCSTSIAALDLETIAARGVGACWIDPAS